MKCGGWGTKGVTNKRRSDGGTKPLRDLTELAEFGGCVKSPHGNGGAEFGGRAMPGYRCFLMRSRRLIIAILIFIIVLVVGIQLVRKNLRASLGYAVEAQFGHLPTDDTELTAWIQPQPGIVRHTVHVERVGSDGTTLRVVFIQSQNLAGEPPLPDLDGACVRFGYSSPACKFRDSKTP